MRIESAMCGTDRGISPERSSGAVHSNCFPASLILEMMLSI